MPDRAHAMHNGTINAFWGVRQSFRGYPFAMVALSAMNLGVTFMVPGYTFANSPAFRTLASIGSETTWGWIFLGIGLPHLLMLVCAPKRAWLAALPILFVYTFVAYTCWRSMGLQTAAVGFFILLALLAFWSITERS